MREHAVQLYSPTIDALGTVLGYGLWGRAAPVSPAERGSAGDFAANGMLGAVADLVEAGRVKLYCVDAFDGQSWANRDLPLEERARRHGAYESWILDQVVPYVASDSGGTEGGQPEIITLGCSMGAYHSLNFALKRADLFPLALCFSGNYDPASWQ